MRLKRSLTITSGNLNSNVNDVKTEVKNKFGLNVSKLTNKIFLKVKAVNVPRTYSYKYVPVSGFGRLWGFSSSPSRYFDG